ncbi:MAG: glycosyltransferase family 4 protein [Elusimicrobia bacterium]|nr:glycosyltransferase family 4 protein [Elusimicrobiota bacterium]
MAGRGKKILHIINIPWYSGLAGYAIDLARFMREEGEEVAFAVSGGSRLYDILRGSYETIPLPGRTAAGSVLSIFRLAKIRRELKAVFAYTGSSCFIAFFLFLVFGIRFVRVRAEKGLVKKNIFNRMLHRTAFRVIVPTAFIMDDFKDIVSRDRIMLLPPVVDTRAFGYAELPPEDTIGIVGRLGRIKGHRVLVEALSLSAGSAGQLRLLIAGDEKDVRWTDIRASAERLGIGNRVEYLGYAGYGLVPGIMRQARVGIISSLGSEAVSRVALEWMSVGRPVVASRVGILGEIVRDGFNGFLVDPGDPAQLSAKIVKLLADRALNEEMGRNARAFIEENFSPAVYRKNISGFLNSL